MDQMEKKHTAASTTVMQLKKQRTKLNVLQCNTQHNVNFTKPNLTCLLKDMKLATSSEQQRSRLLVQLQTISHFSTSEKSEQHFTYTVFQKKNIHSFIGYKLRNSGLILIIFDTKIPHII